MKCTQTLKQNKASEEARRYLFTLSTITQVRGNTVKITTFFNTILLFCTKQLQQSHQSIANFYLKSVWGAKWWYPVASQHRKPWRQAAWGCETELQRSEFLAPGEACWVVSRAAGYTTRLFHSLLAQPQQQAYCLLLGLCMGLSEAFKTIQIPRVKSQGLSHANGEPIMNCNLSRIHIRFG